MGADAAETPFGRIDRHPPLLVLDPFRKRTEDQGNGGFLAQWTPCGGPDFGALLWFSYFTPLGLSAGQVFSPIVI